MFRADRVVSLVTGTGTHALAVVIEVQLEVDDDKRFTWPAYLANLRARTKCPVCVLVVTPSRRVAERARIPIELGPGSVVTPLVIGPASMPVVDDAEVARRDPELAVLSAMAHGRGDPAVATRVALAAASAMDGLGEARALQYLELVGLSLGAVARAAFGELMAQGTHAPQGEFLNEILAKVEARVAAQAKAEGRLEGRVEGKADLLLDVLEARGIALSAEQRVRIAGCLDENTLRAWTRRAVSVATADELFAD